MNLQRIPIILFFLACFQTLLYPSDYKIILLTSDDGLLVSEDNGHSWDSFNQGLPSGIVPLKIQEDISGNYYLLTHNSGIYKFDTNNKKWEDINSKEFLEPTFISKKKKYRSISAFGADSHGSGTILLATKHAIFQKEAGRPWTRLYGHSPENYYTALAFNKTAVYAGSSCNGLFRSQGARSINIASNLPKEPYSNKYYFYEEIAGIEFSKSDPNIIYAALNFGGGVYKSANNGSSWVSLNLPVNEPIYEIYDLKTNKDSLFISTSAGIYRMDGNNKWFALSIDNIAKLSLKHGNLAALITDNTKKYPSLFFKLNNYIFNKDAKLAEKGRNKKALYANCYSINKNLQSYISTIKKCGLNAIVIDMKDDWGDICYASGNKTALEIGAIKKYVDPVKIINAFKKNGIFTIARLVVFKDKRLYNAYNSRYAIWDSKSNSPWKGNPREFWNDPYADFVRNYNIEIAEEVQALGFDEIQFDYIRFPSDGPLDRCFYRFKNNNDIFKSEMLACFLEQAKSRIKIPLSVDIYGYNTWFRMGNIIGQDSGKFSEIVDIICPMVYPSHYGARFFMNVAADIKPYKIVLTSSRRAAMITNGNAIIRPYLQAFKLLSPTWGPGYITSQVKAAVDGGCDGYTFWNAGGNYEMINKAYPGKN